MQVFSDTQGGSQFTPVSWAPEGGGYVILGAMIESSAFNSCMAQLGWHKFDDDAGRAVASSDGGGVVVIVDRPPPGSKMGPAARRRGPRRER